LYEYETQTELDQNDTLSEFGDQGDIPLYIQGPAMNFTLIYFLISLFSENMGKINRNHNRRWYVFSWKRKRNKEGWCDGLQNKESRKNGGSV